MSDEVPVRAVRAAAYVIPTDAPAADGTLSWYETAVAVAHAEAADQTGLGWTYSTPGAVPVVTGVLAALAAVPGRRVTPVVGHRPEILPVHPP